MIFSEIRVKDIDCVLHFTPTVMKFTAQNRRNHIIGIQLSGSAAHYFEDHEFNLSQNCIYFFNQKENYKVEVAEKGLCFSVHFTTYEPIDVKSFCIKIKDNSNILRILHILEQQFTNAGGCTAKSLSVLYKLFDSFAEIYSEKYLPADAKLLQVQEYMHLHFTENDCILKAAEEYGVTQRRFNDIFKQYFHTTPKQYILDYKINLAKKLLGAKELSMGDISDLCGFSDVYHFSKTFKKVTGQTAKDYRKEISDPTV